MYIIEGISASKGIAIGPAFVYTPELPTHTREKILDTEQELNRLKDSLDTAEAQLESLYQNAIANLGQETADIFGAHKMMLKDPGLLASAEEKIKSEQINAEAAFYEAAESYAEMLQSLPDEYLRARAADIRDVALRVVRVLCNQTQDSGSLAVPSIIIADDLTPSDTVQFNREFALGFFTAKGGTTSHTAILSRALGIPAVVGADTLPDSLTEDSVLILDGNLGKLIIAPDEKTLDEYQTRLKNQQEKTEQERLSASQPAVTKDGKHVEVVANIGNIDDAENALNFGAEGVGLFRTEFSYLEQTSVPNEEELTAVYRKIFQVFGDKPVVVRTLDIGGDKEIPHLELPAESNPFLGHRGIRLCLDRPDLFKPQLRAVLRAGAETNLCIMFPMIATVGEIRQAKAVLNQCIAELEAENKKCNAKPQVGVMIEVPSAVVCADYLAKEVDFFSIGTNDLTQYTMAVDRTNANVSHLVSALQPAVLRLIKQVIEKAHDAGIWVGMCGEMAGEPLAVPILLGFGLDEFSMNPPAVPQAKEIIRSWDTSEAKKLAEKVLDCESPAEVENLVKEWGDNPKA